MAAERFDVVVVGAGVMGSATAYYLAREGHSVALVEQFALNHKRGSSHGASRIFRLSYPETRYVQMALQARELWRELERRERHELFTTTGGFDAGPEIAANARALSVAGVFHEVMTGSEVARRFPLLRVTPEETFLYQPDGGIVAAEGAVITFQRGAEAAGATVYSNLPVSGLEPNGAEVTMSTPRMSLVAEVVVVTAGAWVAPLVAPLGIEVPVRPTRETVAYFRSEGRPPTLVEWGDPAIYALPSPNDGLKVGEHIAGPETDPDADGSVNEASLQRIRSWVAEHFPGAAPREHRSETCLYTNTDDEHFILERHDRVVIGSPCSGQGFKFAPLIGSQLAALANQVL